MKRAIAILLAAFVAWSAVQPCMEDRVESVAERSCPMEAALQKASSAHACCAAEAQSSEESSCDGEEHEDGCSPFCNCQCCGMVFLQSLHEHKPVLSPVPVRHMLTYLPQVGQEFPHLIWQPPPFQS